MRILSDFDGVWTDQALEAEFVKLFLAAEAARLAKLPSGRTWSDFRAFEARVRTEPERFGWAPDGRITAFVDEDPFCVPNAIASYIESATEDPRTRAYREGVLDGGFESLSAFADRCFLRATASYREQHPPALVPGADRVAAALDRLGARIVVVSNSPSDKIITWFRAAGIDAGESPRHTIRVRGSAGKQTLGKEGRLLELGGRSICVDRPLYARILSEERPDLVIGDVFSLDLSLPFLLNSERAEAATRLVLRRHDHTPEWTLGLARSGAIDELVEDVAALPELARASFGLRNP